MADWTGAGVATAAVYREMAQRHFAGVSPSYQAIAFAVAADERLLAALDTLAPPKRQPNLLLAAVRLLGGPIDSPEAFVDWTLDNWPAVEDVVTTHRTQTNEPRRCATLLPALAAVPGPLALIEVGASAGLCLLPDRYAYRYETGSGVHRVGTSRLTVPCEVRGPAPLPDALPEVVWRRGLDLHPLDVTDDEDVRWLQALVWPEQTERLESLALALEIARAEPPVVVAGDLLTDLAPLVAEAPAEATVVVYHSAVLAYLGADDRRRFGDTIARLGRDVIWISNEAPGVTVDVAPADVQDGFLLARAGRALAWTGQHGRSLYWL